jgi:hypothetical protein
MFLIDPPSDFADVEEWEKFLNELLLLPLNNVDVQRHIADARAIIAEKKSVEKS